MSILNFKKIIAAIFVIVAAFFAFEAATAGGLENTPTKNGFYLTGDIGAATFQHISDLPLTSIDFLAPVNVNLLSYISGANALNFSWGVGVGWQICPLFRIDATYTYFRIPLRFHSVPVASSVPFNTSTGSANASSNVYLLNAYLNLAVLFQYVTARVQPYIGVGVGFSENRLKDMLVVNNTVPLSTVSVDPSRRTDFAYQFIFGINYRLIRQFFLYAQYSYMSIGKYLVGPGTSVPGVVSNNARFHARSNRFSLGLRYVF